MRIWQIYLAEAVAWDTNRSSIRGIGYLSTQRTGLIVPLKSPQSLTVVSFLLTGTTGLSLLSTGAITPSSVTPVNSISTFGRRAEDTLCGEQNLGTQSGLRVTLIPIPRNLPNFGEKQPSISLTHFLSCLSNSFPPQIQTLSLSSLV